MSVHRVRYIRNGRAVPVNSDLAFVLGIFERAIDRRDMATGREAHGLARRMADKATGSNRRGRPGATLRGDLADIAAVLSSGRGRPAPQPDEDDDLGEIEPGFSARDLREIDRAAARQRQEDEDAEEAVV